MHFEMPKVLEEHRKLGALAGSWEGKETLHPSPWDPKGGPARSRVTGRIDLDGFFLIMDYVQERDGQVTYRGHGVFGYDAGRKGYTLHWFDPMAPPPCEPAQGKLEGNTLMFQHAHPMGHSRYTYIMEKDGRYRFRIENSQDGKEWAPFMDGAYTRT